MAKKPSYQDYYDQALADLNKYNSGGTGKGYWTAVDSKNWAYTDQYGNTTTDVKNPDGSYKYESKWDADAGKWVGSDSLVDVDQAKQNAQNAVNVYGSLIEMQNRYDDIRASYDAMYESQKNAAQERINNQVNQINALRPEYNQQAESAAQQAYINKKLSEKNLGEKLAASGLSGTGVNESARISNENNYGNVLNQTLESRDEALRGLDQQIQNVQAGGNASLSELESAYQQNVLNLLQNQQQQEWGIKQYYDQLAQQQWQNQFNQQQANLAQQQWQQQFDYQQQQDALANQLAAQKALTSKTYGTNSSSNTLKMSDVDKIIKENIAAGVVPRQDLVDAYTNYYGHEPILYNEDNVKSILSEFDKYKKYYGTSASADAAKVALQKMQASFNQNDIAEAARRLGLWS